MTDDELIAAHDAIARSTVAGTGYYLDELNRRANERAATAATRLAERTFWLSVASAVLSVIATIAAVLALVIR